MRLERTENLDLPDNEAAELIIAAVNIAAPRARIAARTVERHRAVEVSDAAAERKMQSHGVIIEAVLCGKGEIIRHVQRKRAAEHQGARGIGVSHAAENNGKVDVMVAA